MLLLPGVVEAAECAALIVAATEQGFAPTGLDYPASYRNNDRLVRDDAPLAARLFELVRGSLPPTHVDGDGSTWRLAGLNERFRFCRYADGQGFRIHRDGAHAPASDRRSFLTLQVYLDDVEDGAGGHTRFYEARTGPLLRAVRPQRGAAVVFPHDVWHDGEPVVRGKKHVLRTDVMYRRMEPVHAKNPGLRGHDGYVWKVLPLAGGGLATASRDRTIRIWSRGPDGFHCARVFAGHRASVHALVEARPGLLWSGSRDREVREWDLSSGAVREVVRHDGAVLCLERLGDRVACGLSDGSIHILDPDGTPRARFAGHTGWVWALAATTAGRLVSGSEDGTVRLWSDLGECIDAASPGRGPVHALAALEGDRVAAGFADGHVVVYAAGDRLEATQIFAVQAGEVYGLAADPRGLLASGGEDDCVRVHRTSDGVCVAERRHADFVRSVAFLADGTLVSGSYDTTVRAFAVNDA
jgi:predicted 2-oxoglutarate/Fe(II)-dependent dioxygenase YbiX